MIICQIGLNNKMTREKTPATFKKSSKKDIIFILNPLQMSKTSSSKETKQIFRNIFNYFKQKLLGAFIFFGLYTENNEPDIEMGIVNVVVDVENDEEME